MSGKRNDRIRALNVPRRVEVDLDGDGRPAAVRRSKSEGGGQAVEDILENWRVDDEWWRVPITRRYCEVVLDGGKRAVLFEDLNTGQWFIQQP